MSRKPNPAKTDTKTINKKERTMTLVKDNAFIDSPKVGKPSTAALKQEVKRSRESNINSMGTAAIIWHLTKRHKFGLMTLYAIAVTAALVVKW